MVLLVKEADEARDGPGLGVRFGNGLVTTPGVWTEPGDPGGVIFWWNALGVGPKAGVSKLKGSHFEEVAFKNSVPALNPVSNSTATLIRPFGAGAGAGVVVWEVTGEVTGRGIGVEIGADLGAAGVI